MLNLGIINLWFRSYFNWFSFLRIDENIIVFIALGSWQLVLHFYHIHYDFSFLYLSHTLIEKSLVNFLGHLNFGLTSIYIH